MPTNAEANGETVNGMKRRRHVDENNKNT